MKNILQQIVQSKKLEVESLKRIAPVENFEAGSNRTCLSLKAALLRNESSGIIAEFKKRSPSHPVINAHAGVIQTTTGYVRSGACALSILTDNTFFGGHAEDLVNARVNNCPILRKDFIIDEYQVLESKYLGADVILLIASILTAAQVLQLSRAARQEGMEVILEIHNEDELDHLCDYIDIVGVNNRNLDNFSVSTDTSLQLYDLIPDDMLKISESGISSVDAVTLLKEKGFNGFLIGEAFMRDIQPEAACEKFITRLNRLKKASV